MFKYLEPEVAGGLGEQTDIDTSVFPPSVHKLEYQFEGWLGDCLVESFPCFVITRAAKEAIEDAKCTGIDFDNVIISKSELFNELYPKRELPQMYWAKINGKHGVDDFGLSNDFRLVISEKVFKILSIFNIKNALVYDYDSSN